MKILIVGWGGYEHPFMGLGEISTDEKEFEKHPEKFKLVVFTGGEDVCPAMYGETSPKNLCGYNINRDIREQALYEIARDNNIKMTGICRGSQFLNVMAGGTLMHHIDHHGTNHDMETIDGELIRVTSTHHQMCIPAKHGFITAWSALRRSKVYYGDKDQLVNYEGREVEGIYYPEENILAVQYHPEYMDKDSRGFLWYRETIFNFLDMSTEEFQARYFNKTLENLA